MADGAVSAMEGLLADAVGKVRGRVAVEGHIVGRLFDREQRATHGLAWLATYVEGLRQFAAYADRISMARPLGRDRRTRPSHRLWRVPRASGHGETLAARIAWAAADMSVQVHGANGVASEFPISRILADARVFGILEGSAEILAQMVARRLLEGTN